MVRPATAALVAANARATGVQAGTGHGETRRAALLAGLAMVVLFGGAALVAQEDERPLAWVVCAVLAAGAVLIGGRLAGDRA